MEDLLPGDARPLPVWNGGRWTISFGPDAAPDPGPVRHAIGYEPFVAFARARGADPAALARDPLAFAAFVLAAGAPLRRPDLAAAAGIFLGDALAALRPGARWANAPSPVLSSPGWTFGVERTVEWIQDLPDPAGRIAAMLADWDEADRRHDATERAMARTEADARRARARTERAADASGLTVAPAFTPPAAGRGPGSGDALGAVAEALIEHLVRHHAVEVARSARDGVRSVDLVPASGAPVRLTASGFPGTRVRAGLLFSEVVQEEQDGAATLDAVVLGIVRGGLAELAPDADGASATHLLRADGTGTGSGGAALPDPADRLVQVADLEALDGAAWPAWPTR